MGMPISLALRGRHADDDARPTPPGHAVMAALRAGRRGLQHLPARLGRSPGSAAASSPLRRLPARGRRGPRARRAGAARELRRRVHVRRPGPDGRVVLDPSGVVKGWAAERAAEPLRALLDDTDFCLSAGGDIVCRTVDPRRPRLADRHRGPARPAAAGRRRPRARRRRRHLRHRPPRPARRRRPHRSCRRPASPRSPSCRPR